LKSAENDPQIRVVVITGAGDATFCAGLDLKALARGEALKPDNRVEFDWGFAGLVKHAISKPLIAAVNGSAFGGGTEIVLACDLAIAVETAEFGLPEVKRGVVAGAGGAIRLIKQLPQKIAMEVLLTGEPLSAQRALDLGLINALVAREQLLDAALVLAGRIAQNAPLSVQATKRIALGISDGVFADEAAAWQRNKAEAAVLMQSEDSREGPRAFAEKRQPVWKAR
jgi:crotonobetainyl-CoA hydratase